MDVIQILRDRLDPIIGRHEAKTRRKGAIAIAATTVIVIFGGYASVTGFLPLLPRGGHIVTANFSSAFNLNTSTPVRVRGINVGAIDAIDSADGGRSVVVRMRVNDTAEKILRADARAHVWQRLVLGGNEYVELEPGRSQTRLGDATIPLAHTSTQVGVDDVTNALKPDARRGIRGMFHGLNDAFANHPSVQRALPKLAPSLRPLARSIRGLRGQKHGDLGHVVDGFDAIATAVDRDEAALGGIVDGAQATLAVTAARRTDLSALLRDAPSALRTAREQLGNLDTTLDIVDPLARELTPGARKVAPALAALTPTLATTRKLLVKAQPLVKLLDPAVLRLRGAARQGVPLMRELQSTLGRTSGSLLPFLFSSDNRAHLPNYQLPGPTLAAVDSLSGLFDSNGHVAHFNGSFGARAFHDYLPCSIYAADPDPSKKLVCQTLTEFLASFLGGRPPAQSKMTRLGKLLGVKP